MLCQKITLLGVGLLGGSLGLALRQRRLAAVVCGYVRRPESIAECQQVGATDHATCDLKEAVRDADILVLGTPIRQMKGLVERSLPYLKPGALVTDMGSVKAGVVAELDPLVSAAGATFIGSHPMAGREKSGVSHATAELFQNAVCAITPLRKTPPEAVRLVRELWKGVGGRVLKLTPELHDELVSRSSHLPQIVASELAHYVLSPAQSKEQAAVCATGFRDTTRLASSFPEMWLDIVLANRTHLARVLGVFIEGLEEFRHTIEQGDEKSIQTFFETAKQRRDAWLSHNPSPE
jgi:prephenate dehydrogenase